MKNGGIVISIIGVTLFIWHLVKVRFNPDYEGYVSHQVMALNAVILIIVGVCLYALAKRRLQRKRSSAQIDDDV